MSRTEAKKIVKRYAKALEKAHYPYHTIYLFGSHVRGKTHRWSDIDVAVVSDKLKRDYDENRFLLWDLRLMVDDRIEPHGFTVNDFANDANPMAYEIRRTGVKVV